MKASSRPDSALLISDLHLEPARPDLVRAFFAFLDTTAHGAGALYILGDLFDVWVGDDDDTPLWGEISAALRGLAAGGTQVFLMHGNRDFLLGERYAAACGARLLTEPHVLDCGDKQYLLLHGDALCTRDEAYQAFRTMVREPRWQQDFLAKPLAERRAFAAQARAQSMSMNSNKPEDIMDVTQDEVERVLREWNIDTLIHGHTHRPAVHEFTSDGHPRRRIVLSDWDKPDTEKFLRL